MRRPENITSSLQIYQVSFILLLLTASILVEQLRLLAEYFCSVTVKIRPLLEAGEKVKVI